MITRAGVRSVPGTRGTILSPGFHPFPMAVINNWRAFPFLLPGADPAEKQKIEESIGAIASHGEDSGLDHDELLELSSLITRSGLSKHPQGTTVRSSTAMLAPALRPRTIASTGDTSARLGGMGVLRKPAARTGTELPALSPRAHLPAIFLSVSKGASYRRKLVKALVPRTTVPVQVPLNIIGRFNAAPASRDNFVENRALQAVCLKWICLAYDLVEDKAKLHALYVPPHLPVSRPALLVWTICRLGRPFARYQYPRGASGIGF